MNITHNRNRWYTASLILVGCSLLSVLVFGFRFGLDFTGGSRWTIAFENQDITQVEVSEFLSTIPSITQSPQVQMTSENEILMTLQELPDEDIQTIKSQLTEQFGSFDERHFRSVDSVIGGHFKTKALWAVFFALAGIIFFVAFAFRRIPQAINPWRFGWVSIIALFHDILIVLGVFVVLGFVAQVELDLPFITALLATLGFSINDTIVILDRVRENIYKQKASETFEDTIEKSIQETLRRSVYTSFSTLLPLLSLLFFGADSIFYFVLALTIGIIVGTYSSIFLVAPLLITWKQWADKA